VIVVKMKFKKIKNKNNLSNLNYSFFVDLLSKYFIVFFKCNYSNFITKGAFFKDIKFENKIKGITNVIDYYFLNIKGNLKLKHYFKGIKGLYHFIYIRSKSLKFLGRLRKISLNSLNNLRKISLNRFKFLLKFKKNLRNNISKKNIEKVIKKNIKNISLKRAKFLERKLKVRINSVKFLKCVKILNPNNLKHFKKMTNLRMLNFYKMITNPKNVKFYNYKKRTNPKFFKNFKILKRVNFFKILKFLKKIKYLKILKNFIKKVKFFKILKSLKKVSYKCLKYKIERLSKCLK